VNMALYMWHNGEYHDYTGAGNEIGDILFIGKGFLKAIDHVAMVLSVEGNGAIRTIIESTGTDRGQGTVEKSADQLADGLARNDQSIVGYGRLPGGAQTSVLDDLSGVDTGGADDVADPSSISGMQGGSPGQHPN